VGILAIDMNAKSQQAFVTEAFTPIYVFLGFFSLFILFRISRVKTSLLYHLLKRFINRRNLGIAGLILVIAYWIGFGLYQYTHYLIIQEKGKRLVAIAATAASQVDPNDLTNLRFARDMQTPEYQRVFKLLNDIRNNNPAIIYTYILRPTEIDGIWEFIVDADANYYIPSDQLDYTGDGIIDESDENVAPGVAFDLKYSAPKMYKRGLYEPVFEDSLVLNQWGAGYTASAPILKDGKPIAVLAIDDAEQIYSGAELYRINNGGR
jgi:hypothetical protein